MKKYYKCIEETKDRNMALARTNINCSLFEEVIKESRENDKDEISYLRAIIWNYIIQAYHRSYGIDLYPDSVGNMYGYVVNIASGKKMSAKLTSGSLRFEVASSTGLMELTVSEIYFRNKNLFLTVIESIKFLEDNVISKLKKQEVNENYKYIYENVYQVLTTCYCMEGITFFINGIEINDYKGIDSYKVQNYIEVIGRRETFCIEKNTGNIILKNGIKIKYKDWCNNIGDGIKFISKLNESYDIPLMLKASIGGYGGPSYSIAINFVKEICTYTTTDEEFNEVNKEKIKISTRDLELFTHNIEKYIGNWKRSYMPKDIIMDGTSWEIEYKTSSKLIESSGSNAYPKNFNDFSKEISNIINKRFS